MRRPSRAWSALPLVAIAASAQAAPIVTAVGAPTADGTTMVQLTALNDRDQPADVAMPDRVAATIAVVGATTMISLVRVAPDHSSIRVTPGSFAHAEYSVRLPDARGATGILTLVGGRGGYAFVLGAEPAAPEQTAVDTTPVPPTADRGNAFLSNLSAYEPIYAVYGPGTSTDALIQISFKYQLIGRAAAAAEQWRWSDGITFAYTQRMYWDLGAKSAPFRNIDFQPEFFYLVADRPLTGDVSIGGQAGVRHESNGRDGTASRSLNTVYLHPTFALPVGRWTLKIGPQAWAYIGDLSDNPDIARYRGNSGLFAEIGRDDGLRVSTSSRINFSSGKGAVNVEVSYPLDRLIGSSLNLYVFGQAFAGYGENLLDYNRHATRLRLGLGFVR